MRMNKKLVAFPLCLALSLQGCGVPAQSNNDSTGEATTTQDASQDASSSQKISDTSFVQKLQNSVYDLIVDDLDESGNEKQIEVQEVKAVYLSKEYIEQYSFNSKETKFFGATLGELEAKFGDQKYVFDIDENGHTVCHAVDDFDNTFEKVGKVALIGGGVILISVTLMCATGGAPVTALVACTGSGAGAITANQAYIALMATSTAIAIFDDGDVGDAAKDIAFDTSSDFIMQAIGGVTVA